MRHLRYLCLFVLVVGAGVPVQGATINVPADQPTIQAAVSAALPGDTVLVADGTYVENVTIDKNITLLSVNGRTVTAIQGVSFAGALGAITVTSNTTAVQIGAAGQGFKVEGIDNGAPGLENAAIYFQGNHSNAQVLYNEIEAKGDHGLLTEYGATISGFVIDNNLFTGQTFIGANPDGNGFGDQFTQPNRPRQLCVMGGGTGGGSTSNTTFTNNQVTGTAGGYNPSAEEQGNTLVTIDSNGATVTGNTFAGVTSRFATSLRCRGPATTISGNVFDSSGIEFPLKATGHIYLVDTGTSSAGVVALNSFNKVVNIDATTATIGWSIAGFAAHPSVTSGMTIEVGPGTYVEQILVDGKDITLQGAGCGSSLIHSPAVLDSSFTTTNVNKAIITAQNAGNVVIDGFTIDGLGLGNANYRMVGVGYWNAGGALTNCCVQNVIDTPFSGSQHGIGIMAANDDGGPYSLEVGNCTVTEFQKNAMALAGPGMTIDVHDCTVTGKGYTSTIAQNGIQGGAGASGTVRDNVITDIGYVGSPWAAGGLLMISGGTIDATGNHTITDVQVPVWWQDTSGSVGGISASGQLEYGSLVYNLTSPAPLREQGPPVRVSPLDTASDATPPGMRAVISVTVTESCFDGTAAPSPFVGLYGYSGGAALDVQITKTSVNGWDYGIVADGAATTVTAHSNDISGNTSAGYDNTLSGATQDATFNWWGAADGPSGDGSGSGDAVASVGGEVSFDPYLTDGTSSTSCAFTTTGNVVEPSPAPWICISGPTPCVSVPVTIARTDNAHMRGFSVDLTLSPELELCAGTSSITEGTYLDTIGGTVFQVLDNGGGSYTVDGAILGLPCGQTAATGTLFHAAVKASGGDGSGAITVDSVLLRDCANAPLPSAAGAAAVIPIDTAGPAAVADLTAAQVKSGNFPDGTTQVDLTFTVPGDAMTTQVYRAPYSDAGGVNAYPEYDDIAGAGPPATPSYPPAAPWTLTGVASSPGTDKTGDRGYWYYVVFTRDACGNWSAVSNVGGGVLNYHLGDVAPGGGDNDVGVLDLTLLGANYGNALIHLDPVNYLDVGPTADFSVDALPQTDNVVQFEDLMMFAINHGTVSSPAATPVATGVAERPELVLRSGSGETFTARLVLRNHQSAVKGIHSLVSFDRDALELVSVTRGEVVGEAFFATLDDEAGVIVDTAVMGTGVAFSGSGAVAELTFRRKQEGSAPVLSVADLRDVTNRPLGDAVLSDGAPQTNAPAVGSPSVAALELVGARPNPFAGSTEIVFRLPDSRHVEVSVYDVSGRLVRTLTDRTWPAGEHRATWDGRAADGSRAGTGVYFYTFRTGDLRQTRKLLHVR